MATLMASTAAELMSLAGAARAGDVIALAPGSYDRVALRDLRFDGEVIITSADPARPAQLTGLKAFGVENITFRNLVLADHEPGGLFGFEVRQAAQVAFDQILVHGPPGERGYDTNAFIIRDSIDISITQSEFTHLRHGINMLDSVGVTVRGNYFHDLRSDGVRGGGVSDIVVADNLFTNFRPAFGDHPDAIQFWTLNQPNSASAITITDNVILRGAGAAVQGIFMGDENGARPYVDVTIADNLVLGGMFNGIYVERADGLSLTDNVVAGYLDQPSWIRVSDVDRIVGNVAQVYIIDGITKWPPAGNQATLPALDKGAGLIGAWLASHGDWVTMAAESPVLAEGLADLLDLTGPRPPAGPVTTIEGTPGANRLVAAAKGDSILLGGDGDDHLTGGAGQTRMDGGNGDDTYIVASSRDRVIERAGGGNDTVWTSVDYTLAAHIETVRLTAGDLTVHGNVLDNRMIGSDEQDRLYGGAGHDLIQGGAGDDHLHGDNGNDTLHGGDGADRIEGGSGDDLLIGGAGGDRLLGGTGRDTLDGGSGNDVLTGGSGPDMFLFRADTLGDQDTIADFSQRQGDRIGLSPIDADISTATDDPFRFLGTDAFSGQTGELRYDSSAAGAILSGDVDGDGRADFTILIEGVDWLSRDAFIL